MGSRGGRDPSPGQRVGGSLRISTVVSITWVVSLVAFMALWTLAPSLVALQSMQHIAAAAVPVSGSTDPSFAGLPELQIRRRARGLSLPVTPGSDHTAAPGTAQDCQRLQQAQLATLPGSQQHNGGANVLISSSTAHTATLQSKPQAQQLLQQQPSPIALDPVHGLPADLVQQLGLIDVVYLWVNGSDPVLTEELQEFEAKRHNRTVGGASASAPDWPSPTVSDNPVRRARFDAGRDELRYSLRSLEMYMPWYNHAWIVTNGQVPTWLNHYMPRVTVVPHSSIFKDTSHLPTFNSNAIQTNIATIPGLSDSFIMMDDDLFLTAPWTLADFVGPDGGDVLTGSTLVTDIKPKGSLFFEMLANTNSLFDKHFGRHKRFDPAHAPRLYRRTYLEELRQKIPDAFKRTSASRARTPKDFVVGPGYMWYVSQFQPGEHPTAPDARTKFISLNDQVAWPYFSAAIADFSALLAANDTQATNAFHEQVRHEVFSQVAVNYAHSLAQQGPRVSAASQRHLHNMITAWSEPGAKMVCLNDDMTDASVAATRPLVDATVQAFLDARYSRRGPFELYASTNGCEGRLPKTAFRQLPTLADYKRMCKVAPPTQDWRWHPEHPSTPHHHQAITAAPTTTTMHDISGAASRPRIHYQAATTLRLVDKPGQIAGVRIATD